MAMVLRCCTFECSNKINSRYVELSLLNFEIIMIPGVALVIV